MDKNFNLNVNDLTKKIKQNTILDNFSAEFKSGNIYGLLGNNGVGKTTLIKCIFNEYNYDSGEILINSKKMINEDLKYFYYFSDNVDLPKNISIYDFLRTQYLFSKNTLTDFEEKLKLKNRFFKNINLKKTKISSLSSGQQKLVSLLACMLLESKIIFFDEPTANLDISNKDLVIQEIKKIDKSDKIIVLITHLVEEVKDLIDEIIILNDGKNKFQGHVSENQIKNKFLEVVGGK